MDTKTSPMNDCSEVFWAYLAGFVDGEGSISLCQNGPRFIVTNTYLPVLEYIKDHLGIGYIQEVGKNNPSRTKQCYHYNIGANGMRELLPKLIPYLMEKKELAIRMLAYMQTTSRNVGGLQSPEYYAARDEAGQYFLEEVARRKEPNVQANLAGV